MYTYEEFESISNVYDLADACNDIGIGCKYDQDYIYSLDIFQDILHDYVDRGAWSDLQDAVRYLPSYCSDNEEYYNYDGWEAVTESDVSDAIDEAIAEMHKHEIYLEGDPDAPKPCSDDEFDIVYNADGFERNFSEFNTTDFNAILGGIANESND